MITGTTRPSSATTGMSRITCPAADGPVAEQILEDLRHLLVGDLGVGVEHRTRGAGPERSDWPAATAMPMASPCLRNCRRRWLFRDAGHGLNFVPDRVCQAIAALSLLGPEPHPHPDPACRRRYNSLVCKAITPTLPWAYHPQSRGAVDAEIVHQVSLFEKCRQFTKAREIQAAGLYPYFKPISESEDTVVIIEGQRRIMLGSNNYLGLTHHPEGARGRPRRRCTSTAPAAPEAAS